MTPNEFCAWLDGYLQGAKKPDPEVIKAKAREIAPEVRTVSVDPMGPFRTPAPMSPQWPPLVGPGIWPQPNRYPQVGDFWCVANAAGTAEQ